ncbi:MAG: hypothetical protein P8Z68_10080 [Kineosporiaceae bacterium]
MSAVTAQAEPVTGRATAFVMTGRLLLLLVAVEFALAGLGAFSGLDDGGTGGDRWAAHAAIGFLVALLAVVLLAESAALRLGASTVLWTSVIAALTLVGQPVLAALGEHASPWFGMLHALDGVAVAAALGILTARVSRVSRVAPVTPAP